MTLRLCHGLVAERVVRAADVAIFWMRMRWSALTGKGGPERQEHFREVLRVLTNPLWPDASSAERSA